MGFILDPRRPAQWPIIVDVAKYGVNYSGHPLSTGLYAIPEPLNHLAYNTGYARLGHGCVTLFYPFVHETP